MLAAQFAINQLTAAGGGDSPQSVYSALQNGLLGHGIGTWREDPTQRVVVLIASERGHNPELYSGGTWYQPVKNIATNANKPISVHCLWMGSSTRAKADLSEIAGATGGSIYNAVNFSDAAKGITSIVASLDDKARFPKSKVETIYPAFTFAPIGTSGMTSVSNTLYLDIQKQQATVWNPYRLVTLAHTTDTLWKSDLPFPTGQYRWRLGFKRPAGLTFLPSLSRTVSSTSASIFETSWTEFTRAVNPPGFADLIAPLSGFNTTTTVTYKFGAVPGATKYSLQIFKNGALWQNLTLLPSTPLTSTLQKSVAGHTTGFYTWRVQALNYDRPAIVSSGWSNSTL